MRPLLIAGPTGAGKSAFALKAAREGGVVINADASQVYSGWRVLTARPDEAEEAEAPHRLYGHIDPSRRYSTGDWLRDLTEELKAAEAAGLRPIIIGGTGLYFTAATSGLASIPPRRRMCANAWRRSFRRKGFPHWSRICRPGMRRPLPALT